MTITVFLKKGQVDFRVLKDGIKIFGGYLGEMKIKESPLFSVRLKNVDSLEEKISKEENGLTAVIARGAEALENGASGVIRIGEKRVEVRHS